MKKLALVHTSFVFILREKMLQEIIADLLTDVQIINIVDDSLLAQVMDKGEITPPIIRRMCDYFVAAEVAGADVILNTCSSLGPAADVARKLVRIPVVKIDEPMAEKAVLEAERIGVLATVPTTLRPTADLIKEKASIVNKSVSVEEHLCGDAFKVLTSGDVVKHDDLVTEGANRLAREVDFIVLAQCSMARLAPRLSKETGLPVLSSPRLGVERVKKILEAI